MKLIFILMVFIHHIFLVYIRSVSVRLSWLQLLKKLYFAVYRLFLIGRTRNGRRRNQRAMLGFFIFGSGVLGNGWTSSLMTDCQPQTGSSSTATPMTVMSSGVLWWRKPMPSTYHNQYKQRKMPYWMKLADTWRDISDIGWWWW